MAALILVGAIVLAAGSSPSPLLDLATGSPPCVSFELEEGTLSPGAVLVWYLEVVDHAGNRSGIDCCGPPLPIPLGAPRSSNLGDRGAPDLR